MVAAMPQNDPLAMIRAFTQPRRNQLAGLASGLLSGNDWGPGMAAGFARAAEGRQMDDAYAVAEAEKARSAEQLQKTISYLRTQPGGATWADAAERGFVEPKQAFQSWYEESKGGGKKQPIEINGQLLDPDTYEVIGDYRDPEKPASKPAAVQEYEYAVSQGYKGTFSDYETGMKKAGATSIDFNANQGTAAAYADRMKAANDVLDDPSLEAAQTDVVQQGLGNVPVAGNFMTSEAKKLADQAQRDFINAILRRESGAVISPSEFENAKQQYFPQPGDTDAVKKQKKANRQTAIDGVARAAGPNYTAPGGVDDPLGIR